MLERGGQLLRAALAMKTGGAQAAEMQGKVVDVGGRRDGQFGGVEGQPTAEIWTALRQRRSAQAMEMDGAVAERDGWRWRGATREARSIELRDTLGEVFATHA